MGFCNSEKARQALKSTNGRIEKAVELLLSPQTLSPGVQETKRKGTLESMFSKMAKKTKS